jgi:hypothetical protein
MKNLPRWRLCCKWPAQKIEGTGASLIDPGARVCFVWHEGFYYEYVRVS